MNRFPVLGSLLLIPALALLVAVGCSPADKKDGGTTPVPETGTDNDKKPKTKADITAAPDGTVKGMVKFKGTPPEPKIDPRIEAHKEKDFCLSGPMLDKQEQMWIIGKDGGVANVVISLAPPSDKKFKKLDNATLQSYTHPVELDQPYCNYVPHVVALYADYQPLVAKNNSKVNHNVKIEAGAVLGGTKDYNILPGKQEEVSLKGGPEAIINASCSIHTWMSSKIALFNHPYFAVTDKDGKFEIKNVPIDTPLTVYLWHESTGKKVAEANKLTAKKGDNELNLEIGAK